MNWTRKRRETFKDIFKWFLNFFMWLKNGLTKINYSNQQSCFGWFVPIVPIVNTVNLITLKFLKQLLICCTCRSLFKSSTVHLRYIGKLTNERFIYQKRIIINLQTKQKCINHNQLNQNGLKMWCNKSKLNIVFIYNNVF